MSGVLSTPRCHNRQPAMAFGINAIRSTLRAVLISGAAFAAFSRTASAQGMPAAASSIVTSPIETSATARTRVARTRVARTPVATTPAANYTGRHNTHGKNVEPQGD